MKNDDKNKNDFKWMSNILSRDIVLGNIDQEKAFSNILGFDVNIYEKGLNTLRIESSPSVGFKIMPNNRLYARDFGDITYTGDVIDWTRFYYRDIKNKIITDNQASLILIDDIDNIDPKARLDEYVYNPKDKISSIIDVDVRIDKFGLATYDNYDFEFWSKIGLERDQEHLLRQFGIFSTRKVWISKMINEHKVLTELFAGNKNYPIYTYYFDKDKFKIYSPYGDKQTKWRSNNDLVDDIGMEKSDFIILTKSRKDRLALKLLLNIESYSFPSENMTPFSLPHKTNLVFYDNDYDKPILKNTGLKRGREISDRFDIPYMFIPTKYQCSDLSELIEKYGKTFATNVVTKLIKEAMDNFKYKNTKTYNGINK